MSARNIALAAAVLVSAGSWGASAEAAVVYGEAFPNDSGTYKNFNDSATGWNLTPAAPPPGATG